jgi:hypothetical protein
MDLADESFDIQCRMLSDKWCWNRVANVLGVKSCVIRFDEMGYGFDGAVGGPIAHRNSLAHWQSLSLGGDRIFYIDTTNKPKRWLAL